MIEQATTGLQCCIVCGRMLTDRALHDDFEQSALAAISGEYPEWIDARGKCEPCVEKYRELLNRRVARAEEERDKKGRRMRWFSQAIARFKKGVSASRIVETE